MFYLVFGATPEVDLQGNAYLYWGGDRNPIGIFNAPNSDEACKAAAKKTRRMGTFAAIECAPWGLELMVTDTISELGNDVSQKEAALADKERQLMQRLTELENRQLNVGRVTDE